MASPAPFPPSESGCGRTLPSAVESLRERDEETLSPLLTCPSRPRTFTSSGWMIVYVPWWKNDVCASTEGPSVDQICAPLTDRDPKVIGVEAIEGSPGW